MSDSYQAIYDAVRSRISGGDISQAAESALREAFSQATYLIPQSVSNVEHEAVVAIQAAQRPSVLFRPKLSRDGNQWCALYGDDLMEGVCGFGDSPAGAMTDFDKNWTTQGAGHADK